MLKPRSRPRLISREYPEKCVERAIGMIRPAVLESERPHGPWSCRGCDVWDAIRAAASGDAAFLDNDPQLVHRVDRGGGTPLHRAVASSARDVVKLLLDRGASIHALHGAGPGSSKGYAAAYFQPIDLALWTGPFWSLRADIDPARLLIDRGVAYDLVIAAALGDFEHVRRLLDQDPDRIVAARPCGKRALSSAVEFGHSQIVQLLLERGADPNWSEGSTAARGMALHAAARAGDREIVELLLAHGADPNGSIDSSGGAYFRGT
jgi:ankyrin repeat protein